MLQRWGSTDASAMASTMRTMVGLPAETAELLDRDHRLLSASLISPTMSPSNGGGGAYAAFSPSVPITLSASWSLEMFSGAMMVGR